MKKNIGSALLITILIIGTVGAIALALGRLTLSEIKISASLSDSVIAYYAAEGGLEDGLWRYRVNHEIEDSCQNRPQSPRIDFSIPCDQNITETDPINVDRIILGNLAYSHYLNPTINAVSATDRAYDLKVYFKQQGCIGYSDAPTCSTVDNTNENIYKLIPDQSKTFDVTNLRNQGGLRINARKDASLTSNWWIEYKYYSDDLANPVFVGVNPISPVADSSLVRTIPLPSVPAQAIKLVVKLLTSEISATGAKSGFVYFGIYPGSATNYFDTGFSYVDSTGYYGTTKRRLRMTIDRESGNILSLLDYALYAGGGNITQ